LCPAAQSARKHGQSGQGSRSVVKRFIADTLVIYFEMCPKPVAQHQQHDQLSHDGKISSLMEVGNFEVELSIWRWRRLLGAIF
jgi:hypothetical protein